ncbi:MAG: hypothetical protein ABI439_04550 [Rhodospirillales bacterium]
MAITLVAAGVVTPIVVNRANVAVAADAAESAPAGHRPVVGQGPKSKRRGQHCAAFWVIVLAMQSLIARIGLAVLLVVSTAALAGDSKMGAGCSYNGKWLYGKVQKVTAFADIKVQLVTAFPDLKVQLVTAFPDACGKWQYVTAFPDLTVEIVTAFPDVKVEIVTAFPGVP